MIDSTAVCVVSPPPSRSTTSSAGEPLRDPGMAENLVEAEPDHLALS
jgi:hypothetical protein